MKRMQIVWKSPGPWTNVLIINTSFKHVWQTSTGWNSNECCGASFWLCVFLCVRFALVNMSYNLCSIFQRKHTAPNAVCDVMKNPTEIVKKWLEPSAIPSGQLDDVPWLDQAAQLVPDRNCNAAGLIRHFTWANLVSIFCFSHSSWQKLKNVKLEPHVDRNFVRCNIASGPFKEPGGLMACLHRPRRGDTGQLLTDLQYDEYDI